MIKKFLTILLLTTNAFAGLPPTTMKGQEDTSAKTKFGFQFPYNTFTDLGGINGLVETGNENLLLNPGFENAGTSWTVTKTSGTTFGSAPETTVIAGGKKSTRVTSVSAYGTYDQSVTPSIYTASRNMQASCRVNTSSSVGVPQICALAGGVEQACATVPATGAWADVSVNFPGPSNGTSVGVRFKTTVSDSASTYLDDCYVGPAKNVGQAQVVTDWTPYPSTFAIGAVTTPPTMGTTSVNFAVYRRVGDSMEIQYNVAYTSGGADGSGTYLFPLPTGYTIDSSKITISTTKNTAVAGNGLMQYSSDDYVLQGWAYNSTNIAFQAVGVAAQGSIGSSTFPYTGWTRMNFTAKVPITGWNTNQTAARVDTTPASWGGYHGSNCGWSNSSGSFSDPATDATCSLTERQNRNFGTVAGYTSGGNQLPGIVLTPPRAGRYFVCANATMGNSSTGYSDAELYDGTNTIAQNSTYITSNQNVVMMPLCGIWDVSTVQSYTLRIRTRIAGGTATLGGSNSSTVEWSIFQLDAPTAAPLLVGSVTSNTTGLERVERAYVTNGGSCAVSTQSGSWVSSISRPGTGKCALTLAAGTFSAAPTCVVSYTTFGGIFGFPIRMCNLDSAPSSSTVTVACGYDNTGNTTANDQDFAIICMGPR
jgi:hypothetical protein